MAVALKSWSGPGGTGGVKQMEARCEELQAQVESQQRIVSDYQAELHRKDQFYPRYLIKNLENYHFTIELILFSV